MSATYLTTIIALAGLLSLWPACGAERPKSAGGDRLRQRMAEWAEEMKLTEEQRMKLRDVFESQAEKLKEIRANTSLTPEQRMQEYKALQDQLTPQVKEILTPDQFASWQEEREKALSAMTTASAGGPGRAGVQGLFAGLNLTEQQQAKLREIMVSQGEKLKELRSNTSLTPEQRMQEFKALQDKIEPQIKEILSPEQFAQWQQQREKMRAAMGSAIGERLRGRMQEALADLNLSEEQKAKLRDVFAAQGEKLKEIRANTNLTPEQRMQEFRAIQEKSEPQIKEILTPDQFAKWQEKREKMRAEFLKAGTKQ